jgi:hypothetical protein
MLVAGMGTSGCVIYQIVTEGLMLLYSGSYILETREGGWRWGGGGLNHGSALGYVQVKLPPFSDTRFQNLSISYNINL